jgi:hypothetical protein
MKSIYSIFKWGLAIFTGFLIGFFVSSASQKMVRTNDYSNRYAAETDLKQGIENYHKLNNKYPDSLAVIDISWLAKEDKRRELLLRPFYYENRGDTYVLWWPQSEL